MRHYGYPEKIVRILANAYKDTFSAVRVNGELSEWFETVMGVLHGCVLSPLLFNIFLEMIMAMALDESNEGADIGGERIGDLRFADGIALLAEQEKGLQKTLTCKSRTGEPKMGMEISIQETECQFLGEGNKKFRLEVEGQELEQTENFVYLGGNISTQEGSYKYVERRIGLARGTWQALGKVWNSKELSKATKTRMHEVLVLSTQLYNAETWTVKEKQKQRPRAFEMACLRKIGGVTRRDRIRNQEIFNRLNIRIGIVDSSG